MHFIPPISPRDSRPTPAVSSIPERRVTPTEKPLSEAVDVDTISLERREELLAKIKAMPDPKPSINMEEWVQHLTDSPTPDEVMDGLVHLLALDEDGH